MRALSKFPALAEAVSDGQDICPCAKIENTYDGTSRISIQIGAFRFVCTNMAVGGGRVFAGGFVSVHEGEIPMGKVVEQLSAYLQSFSAIGGLYRFWSEVPVRPEALALIFEGVPRRHREHLVEGTTAPDCRSVYDAYNVATRYATH